MWTSLAFGAVGALHLLPAAPIVAPEMLSRLYGVAPDDTALLLLMRHRAVLLAIVGLLCLWAAWAPAIRPSALAAATLSVAGFLGFYALYGSPAGALRTIAIADLLAVPPLAFATWAGLTEKMPAAT